MQEFVNISTYCFAPLKDLKPLRERLLLLSKANGLKGTILLSTEGVNLFVAGQPQAIEDLLTELRSLPGLENLTPKISKSTHQPFTRMLVRIKKEIIAFGVDSIQPHKYTSKHLAPKVLKQWLDEGKPLTLIDTRNDYEVGLGTFKNAVPIGVRHFRDFPHATEKLDPKLKDETLVLFCTGGIRCEKAAPFMESRGFKNVFQLDGGILKYFEECGNAHYQGACFVFDKRVGLDPTLKETSNTQCYACLSPLTPEQEKDPRFEKGISCPYCFQTSEAQMQAKLAKRQAALIQVASPLPGSVPYEHRRPMRVPGEYDGKTLLETLSGILKQVPVQVWDTEFSQTKILGPDYAPASPETRVRSGELYYHLQPMQAEPPVNPGIRFLYEDEALIVLEKPAPLPVHPGGRFNRNTLQHLLERIYAPQKPHAAHRLDANTTGILIATRTRHFASLVQPLFSRGEVEKVYLAQVQGHPPMDTFRCDLPISDESKDIGSRFIDENGSPSVTDFRVLQRLEDGTALLEVRPLTGRTNQIRVHLWHLGWPVCGDALYLPGQKLGDTQTTAPEQAPLRLHASRIAFSHPVTHQKMEFKSTNASWLKTLILLCLVWNLSSFAGDRPRCADEVLDHAIQVWGTVDGADESQALVRQRAEVRRFLAACERARSSSDTLLPTEVVISVTDGGSPKLPTIRNLGLSSTLMVRLHEDQVVTADELATTVFSGRHLTWMQRRQARVRQALDSARKSKSEKFQALVESLAQQAFAQARLLADTHANLTVNIADIVQIEAGVEKVHALAPEQKQQLVEDWKLRIHSEEAQDQFKQELGTYLQNSSAKSTGSWSWEFPLMLGWVVVRDRDVTVVDYSNLPAGFEHYVQRIPSRNWFLRAPILIGGVVVDSSNDTLVQVQIEKNAFAHWCLVRELNKLP